MKYHLYLGEKKIFSSENREELENLAEKIADGFNLDWRWGKSGMKTILYLHTLESPHFMYIVTVDV